MANRNVVLADWLFTAPAVMIQPVSGIWLAQKAGFSFATGWLDLAMVLYVFVGACWLPVVWLQIQMHRLANDALQTGMALPTKYHRYARVWFALGWPAFVSVMAIFYLMVVKPDLW